MHTNKDLANEAIDSIVNPRANREIFWEFLPSSNPNHIMLNKMDMEGLKEVFLMEGLDGLSTYEFLSVSYITERGDVFGVDDVDSVGHTQENDKLIVVQGFNLVDHMKKEGYTHYFDQHRRDFEQYQKEYSYRSAVMYAMLILLFAVVFGIFISVNSYARRLQN